MFPVATSSISIQSLGQGYRLGWEYLGEAHRAPRGMSLADAHRESAMLDPTESIRHGRPFGELGSILCGQTRVLGRDPPVFSAGSTGKSLITYSSIRHRFGLGKTTSVLSAQVLTLVALKPKCRSGTWVAYPPHSVQGVRVPRLGLGRRLKRTARIRGRVAC